ncbi:L-asparaginase 2-1 [Tolypocladium paradoxum]|uniref:asparaginase n=1 Tax=Tolypocladium paradoxum TaxID=94208 RepID=A0A2S4L269_9HYPO|nr:L-asparaginase 2-1 [Tolypocladium paradoxum]
MAVRIKPPSWRSSTRPGFLWTVQRQTRTPHQRHWTPKQPFSSFPRLSNHQPPAFAPYPEPVSGAPLAAVTMPPKVTIYGTGGTIAGSAAGAAQTTGYKSGVISVGELIKAVPELSKAADLNAKQIISVGSPDIPEGLLVRMSQQIQKELDSDTTQGVVITHGTDTIEETAFWLDLTVKTDKPIVLVGSMRPATAHSADGPMNLLCAVKLAASECARKRGVMIVLNDRICSPRFTTKTNANSLDTFKAEEQGFLGCFVDSQPVFYYPPCRPLSHHYYFNVAGWDVKQGLPDVDILFGHLGLRQELFQAAVESDADGIVLAGMGSGCWLTDAGEAISKYIRENDFPVVASRRTPWGYVGGTKNYGLGDSCIGGGFLDPQKCRILLQLCLAADLGNGAIRAIFESNKPGPHAAALKFREFKIESTP